MKKGRERDRPGPAEVANQDRLLGETLHVDGAVTAHRSFGAIHLYDVTHMGHADAFASTPPSRRGSCSSGINI